MALMAIQLLGPPEIHTPNLPRNPNQPTNSQLPSITLPENFASFSAAENPCHDFFFRVKRSTAPEYLIRRLQKAWDHDPLTTLKLICNLRGVGGTGKSDKEGLYTAALWLHENHPKTLACNIKIFAGFGYLKDLLEILYRILEGGEVRLIAKREREQKKKAKRARMRTYRFTTYERLRRKFKGLKRTRDTILLNMMKGEEEKRKASVLRKKKRISMAKKALERYTNDPDYRFLHDRVSDLFAELLRLDWRFLNTGETDKISLAAKWCPSIDSSYDKSTLICESIAKRIFPREAIVEYQGIEEAHYLYRVRDRLRKKVLVPLRKALKLPEVYISAKEWNRIHYNEITRSAMETYKKLFFKHDTDRFKQYLDDVDASRESESNYAAPPFLPRQILGPWFKLENDGKVNRPLLRHEFIARLLKKKEDGEVAELKWQRMVDYYSKKGHLRNCIAVCDVSETMKGTPIEVCLTLGLLVSELSDKPWKGKVITFSEKPRILKIKGESLWSKVNFLRLMDYGRGIDFEMVFKEILNLATDRRLKEDEMIKRVFVLTDKKFDKVCGYEWGIDYKGIQRKFRQKGFKKVPEIVFWNINDGTSIPVASKKKGVAMVNGFSKNLWTFILEEGGVLHPDAIMKFAISGEQYKNLVVFD